MPSESPEDSPWSSTASNAASNAENVITESHDNPSSLIINKRTMPFLQNMSRWAMYPKFEFEARKSRLVYRATVDEERGVSPEQFQSHLDLLCELAELNRACNV